MDKSTLSRDVKLLQRKGWLEEGTGKDARTRPLRITAAGSRLLENSLPAWRSAQDRAKSLLGQEGEAALFRVAGSLSRIARVPGT
jgi:DNA-binding MarR family transcriptional regulator